MDLIFEAYRLVVESMTMKKYGHTLWIDPKGKIIDITGKPLTHYGWLAQKLTPNDPDSRNDIYGLAAEAGWIQVRNHVMTMSSSISFTGPLKYIRNNKKAVMDIIDQELFDMHRDHFLVDFLDVDENGDVVGKRITFKMPDDDSKLRRFI